VAAKELKRQLDAQAQEHAAEIEALKAAHADELRKQADEFKANLDQAYQQFSDENARLQANLQSSTSALREESSQVAAADSQSVALGSSASAQLLKPGVIAAKVQAVQ
jgi:t-SNARE complex subunit (syntaxin)